MQNNSMRGKACGGRFGSGLFALLAFSLAGLGWPLQAASALEPDRWLEGPVRFPPFVAASQVVTNEFASLRAEFLSSRLKVTWKPESMETNLTVTLHTSADRPGHWPARDWQSYPATWRDLSWESILPVDHVDVPIIYFLGVHHPQSGEERFSPMRICLPRGLGMEQPTRIFWPFLEGFEEGAQSWRLLSPTNEGFSIAVVPQPKNGKAALLVTIPTGKRSATVATTRVRGWQVLQQNASGLGLWLRAVDGEGLARFSLISHAIATNHSMASCRREAALTDSWEQILLPFQDFPDPPLAGLDLFTIEFVGTGPCRFLLDDLQLLGPWPLQ